MPGRPLPAQQVASSVPTVVTPQNNTGELPYSTTIGSSTEHIDLASGNLIINVPFVSLPGRHMSFDFGIRFDARFWTAHPDGMYPYWAVDTRNWLAAGGIGWTPAQGYWTRSQAKRNCNTTRELQSGYPQYYGVNEWEGGYKKGSTIVTDKDGLKHTDATFVINSGSCGPNEGYEFGNLDGPSLGVDGNWSSSAGVVGIAAPIKPDGSSFASPLVNTYTVPPTAGTSDFTGSTPPYGTLFSDLVGETDVHGNTQLNAGGGVDSIGRQPVSQVVSANQIQYTIPDTNGVLQVYTVLLETIPIQTDFDTFFASNYIHEASGSAVTVSEIDLPNGQHYGFQYDSYGYVTHIDLPTGGTVDYVWAIVPNLSVGSDSYRSVTRRTVYDGHNTSVWDLSYTSTGQVSVLDPADEHGVRANTVYTFNDFQQLASADYQTAAGGPSLKRFDLTYDGTLAFPQSGYDPSGSPFLTAIQTTLDGQLVSRKEFDYDVVAFPYYADDLCGTGTLGDMGDYTCQQYIADNDFPAPLTTFVTHGNVTAIREYDWGQGQAGPLLRQTIRTYLDDQNPLYFSYPDPNPPPLGAVGAYWNRENFTRNIVDKVATEAVYDGSALCSGAATPNPETGTIAPPPPCTARLVSQTSYIYDNGSPQTYGYFGDLTSVVRQVNTGGNLTNTYGYDQYGNLTSVTDPKGNLTTIGYGDAWSGSMPSACTPTQSNSQVYPTSVVNALSQRTAISYYPCSGLKQSVRDPNDIAAARAGVTYTYDLLNRPTQVNEPDGGSTSSVYNDAAHTVSSTTLTGGSPITKLTQEDLLGRAIRTQLTSDPDGVDFVDTVYDGPGRVYSVSNPYRSVIDPTYGLTSTTYDALGRKTVQTMPDGNTLQWCYDGVASTGQTICKPNSSTAVNGTWVDSSDEAGHIGQEASDGLGRLVAVMEPDPTSGNLALETDYGYDTLGNLTNVNQKGKTGEIPRTRGFTYDSLSRLLTARNPETGTVTYSYTATAGALCSGDPSAACSKTDTSGMAITYTYDALNRMLTKTAPDGYTNAGYSYDQGTNGIGRLWAEVMQGSAGTIFQYDTMGRTTGTTWYRYDNQAWSTGMAALYDLAGNIKQLTYPDGRVVQQNWDAAGHLASVADVTSGGSGATYFAGSGPCPSGASGGCAQYWPSGSLQADTLGNGVTESLTLNNRLQPCHSSASSSVLPANSLGSSYGNIYDRQSFYNPEASSPCGSQAQNNGNIWSIADNRMPGRSQSLSYDNLNRLTAGSDSAGDYSHLYNYDSFGNMVLHDNLHTPMNYWIDPATNRLMLNTSDLQYNTNGTLLSSVNPIGPAHSYLFTAEDYLRCIDGCYTGSYLYNALGERTFDMHQTFDTWNENVYLNGQPMADIDNNYTWTDYIYANGQKVAMVASQKPLFHMHGVRDGSTPNMVCGVIPVIPGMPASWGSQQAIQPGDTLVFDIRQTSTGSPLTSAFAILFADGSGTGALVDGAGNQLAMYGLSDDAWHHSVSDLSDYQGETMTSVLAGIQGEPWTGYGTWDVWLANVAVVRADGTVLPIFNGQSTSVPGIGSTCGGNGQTFQTDLTPTSDSAIATNYYVDDHLGTTQIELGPGGWPVWKGEFTPFGEEVGITQNDLGPQPADGTAMRYKFTGKERDQESGLDYFGARYYASNMGRWISPDWADKPEAVPYSSLENPQSLNLYGYVYNNPLSQADSDGHWPGWLSSFWRALTTPPEVKWTPKQQAALDAYHKQQAEMDAELMQATITVIQGEGFIGAVPDEIPLPEVKPASVIPDDANVVRGGSGKPGGGNSPEGIEQGTGTHPAGITGFSVESAPGKSVAELAKGVPNGQVGCCKAGDIRAAGGDVIKTSGRSENHATVTGLPPAKASELLTPTVPNPNKVKPQ